MYTHTLNVVKEPEHLTRRIDWIRCWTADELLSDPRRRIQGIFLFPVTFIPVRDDHPDFYLPEAVGIKSWYLTHLVQRLRIRSLIPPFPPFALQPWLRVLFADISVLLWNIFVRVRDILETNYVDNNKYLAENVVYI